MLEANCLREAHGVLEANYLKEVKPLLEAKSIGFRVSGLLFGALRALSNRPFKGTYEALPFKGPYKSLSMDL